MTEKTKQAWTLQRKQQMKRQLQKRPGSQKPQNRKVEVLRRTKRQKRRQQGQQGTLLTLTLTKPQLALAVLQRQLEESVMLQVSPSCCCALLRWPEPEAV
jgi:hypothetical protein